MRYISSFIIIVSIYSFVLAGEVRLTTWGSIEMDPCWSPDRSKIAFDSNYTGNTEIWVMNADGSNKINITNNPSEDFNPAWSPDGTKIAFVSNRTGLYQIWTCSPTGSSITQITNLPYNNWLPAWSPNMQYIAHKTDMPSDAEADIYIYNLASNSDTVLINTPYWEQSPDWSKYNNIIAYDSYRPPVGSDIFTKPAFGGSEFMVTSQVSHDNQSANWCFDDTKLLFYQEIVDGQLWIINSSGGVATQLTFSPSLKFFPDISDDNELVAYCKDNYGNYDIYSCPFAELGQIGVEERHRILPTSLGQVKAMFK